MPKSKWDGAEILLKLITESLKIFEVRIDRSQPQYYEQAYNNNRRKQKMKQTEKRLITQLSNFRLSGCLRSMGRDTHAIIQRQCTKYRRDYVD